MSIDAASAGSPGSIDPVALARELIRCPSVTPADAGALDVLQAALAGLGFTCHRLPFGGPKIEGGDGGERVDNLYARIGDGSPNFCFAGHTDVVPPGRPEGWKRDPFAGEVAEDALWGRGAADMKGAIACFVAAAAGFLGERGPRFDGSISLLITGDEEGPAVNGTARVLDWLAARNETPDLCLVGEPTNPHRLGEMVKIGRRGSLNARITVEGVQGHTAYPHLADNPIHRLVRMLAAVIGEPLDEGTEHFQPSTLQLTTFDVGNPASNVIPEEATAALNIRFNDRHTGHSLTQWLKTRLRDAAAGAEFELDVHVSGEAFLTPPGPLSDAIVDAVETVLGRRPELSTIGGTSDARFIKNHCPVAEFGLVGETMHKTDERAPVADIAALTRVYRLVLERVFAADRGGA